MSGDGWKTTLLRRGVLFVGVVGMFYVVGAFSAAFETFPYPQLLERPFWALEAYEKKQDILESAYETGLWGPSYEREGVVQHDPDQAYEGYTFFTSGDRSGARLVDMDGEVVHEWEVPFREVWSEPPHTGSVPPEEYICWRRAHMYRNGDVVAVYTTVAGNLFGYGVVKVDADSNVIWKYAGNAHHDLAVAEDGSIYTLVHAYRSTSSNPVPGVSQYPRYVLEESLVKLSEEGRELQRVNLLDVIAESEYRGWLQMYGSREGNPARDDTRWDVLHANDVSIVGEGFAEEHAFAEAGQVLVSFRALSAVMLVDVEREEVVWATRGIWRRQHDPDPLPNGEMMVFDNRGYGGPGGASRIMQFDPTSREVSWSYRGTPRRPFHSEVLGSQQKLPNGNVLVTSSKAGRIFEVTPSGERVWEYENVTEEGPDGQVYRAVTMSAERVARFVEF
jgi:hypothetical protein